MGSKFELWSNRPINSDNAHILLKELCQIIVQTFFVQHAGLVANYLNALLSSTQMTYHHTTVYKMATLFLNEDANYIQAFNDIIVSAHKTVSENKQSDIFTQSQSNKTNTINENNEKIINATELVARGIDYLKAREKQRFTKKYNVNSGDYESTSGGPSSSNTPHKNEIIIRWDVEIRDITPFPQTGLKDVSNALWGVQSQT